MLHLPLGTDGTGLTICFTYYSPCMCRLGGEIINLSCLFSDVMFTSAQLSILPKDSLSLSMGCFSSIIYVIIRINSLQPFLSLVLIPLHYL